MAGYWVDGEFADGLYTYTRIRMHAFEDHDDRTRSQSQAMIEMHLLSFAFCLTLLCGVIEPLSRSRLTSA